MLDQFGRKRFAPGDVIFTKGENGSSAFLIEDGLVEVRDPDTGAVLAIIGQGELIGEVALIDRRPRTATAQALKPTVLIEVSRDLVEQLLIGTDPIIRHLLNVVLRRFRYNLAPITVESLQDPPPLGLQEDSALQVAAAQKFTLLGDMRHALDTEQFVLFYQPIYLLEGRQLAGFEALIRWKHPTFGLVSPMTFLELAEESGLIREMGLWVVQRACQDWPQLRPLTATEHPYLSVNISPTQLADSNFADAAIAIQTTWAITPHELKLELTESTFIQNQSVAQQQLLRLAEFGNSIALDDYGTGFSGLSHLQNYHFHTLKLDQVFIREIEHSTLSFQLVRSTLEMIRALQINAVGEGIETEEVARILHSLGCEYGQGYLLGMPSSLEDLLARAAAV